MNLINVYLLIQFYPDQSDAYQLRLVDEDDNMPEMSIPAVDKNRTFKDLMDTKFCLIEDPNYESNIITTKNQPTTIDERFTIMKSIVEQKYNCIMIRVNCTDENI